MISSQQYVKVLLNFNQETDYLSLGNNNELLSLKKSNLWWWQRVIRFFWKPETERIQYVVERIFKQLQNDSNTCFQDFSEQQLSVLSSKLNRWAVKATLKIKNESLLDTVNRIQQKINVVLQENELQKNREEHLKDTKKHFNELTESNNAKTLHQVVLEETLAIQQRQVDAREEEIRQLNSEVNSRKHEIAQLNKEIKIAQEESLGIIDHVKKDKIEVERLKQRKKWLEADTVLWADDGFVFTNSACFPSDSLLNLSSHSHMPQIPQIVKNKIVELEGRNKEQANFLQSINKHIYLEKVSLRHLKMALLILEKDYIYDKMSIEECKVIEHIADYLLLPKLQKIIKKVKAFKIAKATEKISSPSVTNQTTSQVNAGEFKRLKLKAKYILGHEPLSETVKNFIVQFAKIKLINNNLVFQNT